MNCLRLRTIQSPAEKLRPVMLYHQVQYLVEEGDWKRQGDEIDVGGSTKPGEGLT
ncbi:MAG: hypothetical protein HY314_02715 [Acidobacteria bacterium]|nr:hypothetical protein [Acidobacteriota bacterium]